MEQHPPSRMGAAGVANLWQAAWFGGLNKILASRRPCRIIFKMTRAHLYDSFRKQRMIMSQNKIMFVGALIAASLSIHATQASVDLGTSASFAVMGGAGVTNTGGTYVRGDMGAFPTVAITGFYGTTSNEGPGVVVGNIYQGGAVAEQAQADAQAAYNHLQGLLATQDLTGMDLGGMTLNPGVYKFDTSAQLTGTLVLDGSGTYVFQIGSTLNAAGDSAVDYINGANPFTSVFWQVGTSATIETGANFAGTIIADQSVSMLTGATLDGRVFALEGSVTLQANLINAEVIPLANPAVLSLVSLAGVAWRRRRQAKADLALSAKAAA